MNLRTKKETEMGREDEIRAIAYRIWEEEGCVDGHDVEHWLKAEQIWENEQARKAASMVEKREPAVASTRTKRGQRTRK